MTQHSRRNVWMVSNSAWYLFNFRAGLIKGLLGAGYSVTVCSPPDAYLERLTGLGVSHVELRLNPAGTNPLREIATLWHFWRLLHLHRPRVLLTFTPKVNIYFALVAGALRIACIPNVSGLGRAFTAGGWLEAVARMLYRLAFRSVQMVFFQNRDDRDLFVRSGFVESEACRTVPGAGIDLQHFSPAFIDAPRTGAFRFLLAAYCGTRALASTWRQRELSRHNFRTWSAGCWAFSTSTTRLQFPVHRLTPGVPREWCNITEPLTMCGH